MSTSLVVIPPEDACVVARLSQVFARRLVHGSDAPVRRQTLMRALFGLQRLPILIHDLNLSISAGRCQFQINSEHCGFVSFTEDWHTEFRIQYFPVPRRFVWNPTVRMAGRRRARWACGQAAFEPVHMSTGR
jgi:hypothetical protein